MSFLSDRARYVMDFCLYGMPIEEAEEAAEEHMEKNGGTRNHVEQMKKLGRPASGGMKS